MKIVVGRIITGTVLLALIFLGCKNRKAIDKAADSYSGSESCIECHEKFYNLWAPSYHGKAMQPIDGKFYTQEKVPASKEFEIENNIYRVAWEDTSLVLFERSLGREKKYPVIWSLGGKNVYCFLTPLDKGKLQTIPLAYDENRKTWFNYPESAVRHFVEGQEDEALPWRDRMYTFNTGCYNCHVSQLDNNFDLATQTYQTTWREAGINCETCHGPSAEHVKVCREAKEGEVPKDLKIIITGTFTPKQHNASCAPCHAKMRPLTASYTPGDRYFDNFDLTTFEDPDFYPDGRDLGENYTLTGWMLNKCMGTSSLNCVSCHTSSGRNRFADSPNDACISCHQDKGDNLQAHTMHDPNSEGSLCVSCHMPKREFVGHFIRSDHSFRPPMPEATIKFKSPNACNECHSDKSAEWANNIVKRRKNSHYQDKTLYWGQLIKEARAGEWNNLARMLDIIEKNTYGEVVTNSFIRLLEGCNDDRKWEILLRAGNQESPLVRSSVATGLAGNFSPEAKEALLKACADEYRVVRVSAALSLSAFPDEAFTESERFALAKATDEYKKSLMARPDDWSAHYNMGIYYQNRGNINNALKSYDLSAQLYPQAVLPLVNSSVLYSYIGNQEKAEENLRKAVAYAPDNEAANLNLGLLLAEQGKSSEAKTVLTKVLEINPQQAVAAYNLSVIYSENNLNKAIEYAERAANAAPGNSRYGYTLAFFQNQEGNANQAIATLKNILKKYPGHMNSVYLLGQIYSDQGEGRNALDLYNRALGENNLSEEDKATLRRLISGLGI